LQNFTKISIFFLNYAKILQKGFIMGIGTWQIIVILVIVLLLFGGKKIPELAQGLGKGIKNFKDAVKEGESENPQNVEKVEKIEENKKTAATQNTEKKDVNA
jgi:sec-independent protein translocase protein TatA